MHCLVRRADIRPHSSTFELASRSRSPSSAFWCSETWSGCLVFGLLLGEPDFCRLRLRGIAPGGCGEMIYCRRRFSSHNSVGRRADVVDDREVRLIAMWQGQGLRGPTSYVPASIPIPVIACHGQTFPKDCLRRASVVWLSCGSSGPVSRLDLDRGRLTATLCSWRTDSRPGVLVPRYLPYLKVGPDLVEMGAKRFWKCRTRRGTKQQATLRIMPSASLESTSPTVLVWTNSIPLMCSLLKVYQA